MSNGIDNRELYLSRMEASMQEKLKIVRFFPSNPKRILDVGCANGAVTVEIARMFPDAQVLGIDLDEGFTRNAQERWAEVPNVRFRRSYLRDLLAEPGQPRSYDVVSFISVLHEFYTYGEGMSSVVKALADAYELTNDRGSIPIRDMMVHQSARTATLHSKEVLRKIKQHRELRSYIRDHETNFGPMTTIDRINHFLLKYWYQENWPREGQENYLGVTIEDYLDIFRLFGMKVQHQEHYLMPFLRDKWVKDFGLTEAETDMFKSTGLIVASR